MYQHATWLRTVLRSSGVLRLASTFRRIGLDREKRRLRQEYELTRPTSTTVDVGGLPIVFEVHSASSYAGIKLGREPHVVKAVIERARTGDVAWDVGAMVGYFTLLLAKKVGPSGKVYAFEPNPIFRDRIMQNAGLNHFTNIEVVPAAMGAKAGTLTMPYMQEPGKTLEVDLISGDAWVEVADGRHPNLIKMDVEGMEEETLKGLSRVLASPLCHTVIIEIHFRVLESKGQRHAPKRIVQFLRECGFAHISWPDASHLAAWKKRAS